MTRDDYRQWLNSLSPNDLNAEVAQKVMGWDRAINLLGERVFAVDNKVIAPEDTWLPSSDIAAADEVLDNMCHRGFRYELRGNLYGNKKHWCCFYESDWSDSDPVWESKFCDTRPKAICIAAMVAIRDTHSK